MSLLDRREMLRIVGGAVAASVLPQPQRPQTKRPKRVIIAGGGIGGLCCGYELMMRGHEVVLLEAAGRTGGHVKTIRDPLADGLYADVGAEHFTKPGYDRYWGYVREFNLTPLYYPHRENVLRFFKGKMYTEADLANPTVLAQFGFNQREMDYLAQHPWWDLASLYLKPYLDSFHDEYQPFEVDLDQLDRISFTDLLKRDGASPGALEHIGNDGSALHVIWHAAILKRRGVPLAPPVVYRLKGGNQVLPDAFAAWLGERIHLGAPVTSITRGETGVRVRYREAGSEKTTDGDYLVCCMNALVLRQLPVTPAWPEYRRLRHVLARRVPVALSLLGTGPSQPQLGGSGPGPERDVENGRRGGNPARRPGGDGLEQRYGSRCPRRFPTDLSRQVGGHRAGRASNLGERALGHGVRDHHISSWRPHQDVAGAHGACRPRPLCRRLHR